MSKFEFEDVKAGQKIRLHRADGFSEGLVESVSPSGYIRMLGQLWGDLMTTRVELLSEPVPEWPEGTLAEIEWPSSTGGRYRATARMVRRQWRTLEGGLLLRDDDLPVTAVRPLRPVPVDAVVINPEPILKEVAAIRLYARHLREGAIRNGAGLDALADRVTDAITGVQATP